MIIRGLPTLFGLTIDAKNTKKKPAPSRRTEAKKDKSDKNTRQGRHDRG